MKIGINLVGISYNDGVNGGRYRNYKDAIDNFHKFIINPLINEKHEISTYIFSYDNPEKDNILKSYPNIKKFHFINENYNLIGGGDLIDKGIKIMSISYIKSLEQLLNEDLDLIISTRFDINFLKNPFKEYQYDFSKLNFLWREPEFTHLPLINDTFIVFPYFMIEKVIDSIIEMELHPPQGVNIAMHNWYIPAVNKIGIDKVQWVSDKFKTSIDNKLYKLTRHE